MGVGVGVEVETTLDVSTSRRGIIKRPRLTSMLDESGARIILLVAPAGYGKTTLAREWLDDRRAAWYRGGAASADVAALAVGIATAAAEIVPGAGDRMRQRLRATDRPEEDARILAEMLAEDLTDWPEDAWLAIDDYHHAMEAAAAEEFVEGLTQTTSLGLVIASRRRPGWCTARRRVYGEVLELNTAALAMTDREAFDVLSSGEDISTLIKQAAGWPAVIGLAALTGSRGAGSADFADSLSDYFAQELYESAEPGVRWGLCQLAIVPTIGRELAEELFGADTARLVLDHAAHLGVLTPEGRGLALHPLFGQFLRSKTSDFGDSALEDVVAQTGRFFLREQQWDDAFALAKRFSAADLLVNLVDAATDPMLLEGRLATLERWLEHATLQGVESASLDLARAHVALRGGRYGEAESLALDAVNSGTGAQDVSFVSRAYSVAGHSAHLASHEDAALLHYQAAERSAPDGTQMREALWGQLLCALDLDRPDSREALARLESAGTPSPDDSLRLATGKLFLALRQGIGLDLDHGASHLIPRAVNPMVRSSFLHAWVFALAFSAHYDEALEASEIQISEAKQCRLDFALPSAYLNRAMIHRGLAEFRRAHSWFDKPEVSAGARVAKFAAQVENAKALLLIAEGHPEEALTLLDRPISALNAMPPQALRCEYIACRALAYSACGALDEALESVELSAEGKPSVEARVLGAGVRATVALQQCAEDSADLAFSAFDVARTTGNFDSFVCAYRPYPELAAAAAQFEEAKPDLALLLAQANDVALATRIGLRRRETKRTAHGNLSPREDEVYQLLGDGLSNREIARKLFISEGTVKVHVRNVLEKLGVKTRTQAAVRAVKERRG